MASGQFVGLVCTGFGIYLLNSAVKNRKPLQTLRAVVKSPGKAVETVRESNGQGYVLTPPAPSTNSDGKTTSPTGPLYGSQGPVSAASGALQFARTQIGKPYKYGATGPASWDCSGLTQAAYASQGVKLPRRAIQQSTVGKAVARKDLKIGDLVFPSAPIHHVQIYAGNGMIVEAPKTGLNVREVKMWGFYTARRVVG